MINEVQQIVPLKSGSEADEFMQALGEDVMRLNLTIQMQRKIVELP